jgi:FixJ family two-component response regulator
MPLNPENSENGSLLIALVDDDASILRGLSRLLLTLGFRVVTYDSGESFLNCKDAEQPSCIVIDLFMRGLTGPDVRKELRLRGDQTPVIFMTAHHETVTKEILQQVSEVPCLRKPFTGQALLSLVYRTIRDHAAGPPPAPPLAKKTSGVSGW